MSITFGKNIDSLKAQVGLNKSTSTLSKSFERLSSGLRINSASDDPAGLMLASTLNADVRVFAQASRNVNDGISLLNVAEGALNALNDISLRLAELAEQAANGSYSSTQRSVLDSEADALVEEYNRIIESTSYNGITLLDITAASDITIQAGYGAINAIRINTSSLLDRDATGLIGTGSFAAAVNYSSPSSGAETSIEDFNEDGYVDILSSSGRLLLGNGDGTFKAPNIVIGGGGGAYTDAADFNGDGNLDALLSFNASNNVQLALGNGDGTFKAPTLFVGGVPTKRFEIRDLNGDGSLDLVSANGLSSTFSFIYGNGNGTFKAPVAYSTTFVAGTYGIAIADLNNDNRYDVVAGVTGGYYSTALGNGDGTFKAATVTNSGRGTADELHIGDINGDSILDIVGADYSVGGFTTLLGNGNGTFKIGAGVTTPLKGETVELVDFNGDGFLDIAVANAYAASDQIGISLGNGDGTFKAISITNVAVDPYDIKAKDLNGDGVLDLVTGNFASSTISVFMQGTMEGEISFVSTLAEIDLTTQSAALQALTSIESTLERIALQLGAVAAFRSRLEVAHSNLQASTENFRVASSRITDVDVAEEITNMLRLQIIQQAATAVIAQANLQPQMVLRLITD